MQLPQVWGRWHHARHIGGWARAHAGGGPLTRAAASPAGVCFYCYSEELQDLCILVLKQKQKGGGKPQWTLPGARGAAGGFFFCCGAPAGLHGACNAC